MKMAVLFPGQGSQRVGMGRALAEQSAAARAVYAEADDALGFAISKACFEGPEELLIRTEYTQPAILTTSIAVLRALEAERGLTFDLAAGHSLGEWSALVAAGALGLADAVRLVHLRGQAMQRAVPAGVGAMTAITGLPMDALDAVCAEVRGDQVCTSANLNGGDQIVVSGHAEAVDRVVAAAPGRGARGAVRLQVSAPFHCALMAPAAAAVRAALAAVTIGPLRVPVISNVDAQPNRDATRVADLLVAQITGAVRWEDSMRRLIADGCSNALELGAGTVLKGLARRIDRQLQVTSIGEPAEVAALALRA